MKNLPITWLVGRTADPAGRDTQGIKQTVKSGNDLVINDHGKSDLAYDQSGNEEQFGLRSPGSPLYTKPQFCNHGVASHRNAIQEIRLPLRGLPHD